MKNQRKILLVFSFLVLAGGGIFPQEVKIGAGSLTIGGQIRSGLQWNMDDIALTNDSGQSISANSGYYGSEGNLNLASVTNYRTWDSVPLRADLSLRYAIGSGGFKILIRDDKVHLNDGASFYPRYAYAWLFLFDNVVRLTGGWIVVDSPWGTGGPGDWGWNYDGRGMRVEIRPFSIPALRSFAESHYLGTLNFGVQVLVPTSANTAHVYGENWEPIPGAGNLTLKNVLGESLVGFRWTFPWFRISAMYHFDSLVDNGSLKHRLSKTLWSAADEDAALYFGLQVTGVRGLTLSFDGLVPGLGNMDARGRPEFHQVVQYSFANLEVPYLKNVFLGVRGIQKVWCFDMMEFAGWDFSLKPWIQVQPYIGYNVTEGFRINLEGGVAFGHLTNGVPTVDTGTTQQNIVYENLNVFIRPGIVFNFGNGLEIRTWYSFTKIAYGDLDDGPGFADRAKSNLPVKKDGTTLIDSITKHQAALQFAWNF